MTAVTTRRTTHAWYRPDPEPRPPAREGVLWQPCPTCGAEPGESCTSLRDGYSTLHDFHRARPDGYPDD